MFQAYNVISHHITVHCQFIAAYDTRPGKKKGLLYNAPEPTVTKDGWTVRV